MSKLRKGNFKGLGLTANGMRPIVSGAAYDKHFPKPLATDPILNKNGEVNDTVEYCKKIVLSTLNDTKSIAATLLKSSVYETCRATFDFYFKHYQYKQDKDGVEQLRRPARAWRDRGTSNSGGIDCDCFSISISSVLINLGIPHYFRIVKMYGRDYFQHIYVVVPKFKGADMKVRNNYIVIDPVLDKFDFEAPGITFKQDKEMGMPIQYLNGVNGDAPRLGQEFEGLGSGLGSASGKGLYTDYLRRKKLHLINTRNHIAKNPHKVANIYQPKQLIGMYDELIGSWNNEATREATLEKLSRIENDALRPELRGLANIIHNNDSTLWGAIDNTMDGLGKAKASPKKAAKAAKKETKKAAPKKAGVFTKVKNATKKVKEIAKTKGAGALKKVKKVAKAVVKYNPITLAARGSFLVAMKTNFGRLASRAYWAYHTEAAAKAKGVSAAYYKSAQTLKANLEKVFVTTLKGDANALKKSILTGRAAKTAAKLAAKGQLTGAFGVVETATITAALSFLTPILAAAKKLFSKHKDGGDGPEEDETGGENTPANETDSDPGATVEDDGAEEELDKANEEEETSDDSDDSEDSGTSGNKKEEKESDEDSEDESSSKKKTKAGEGKSKGMSTTMKVGLGVGGALLLAGIGIGINASMKEKKKAAATKTPSTPAATITTPISGVKKKKSKKKKVSTIKLS